MISVQKGANGLTLDHTVVFSCGCGNTTPKVRRKLQDAGVANVPVINTNSNSRTRQYIKQVGLDKVASSLKRSKHAVLFNPSTGRYLDILNAPQTPQLLNNIRRVVEDV